MLFRSYKLADGSSWDDIKERVADQLLNDSKTWVTNLNADNLVARFVDSPLDSERYSPSFQQGDNHGAGAYFHQINGHRPTPDLAQYKVPGVDGFYLVGPFMHPAGGVFGAGRGTAIKMFGDLGIDFEKVATR